MSSCINLLRSTLIDLLDLILMATFSNITIILDNSFSSKKAHPMEVYHTKTPVRSVRQSLALFKCHQHSLKDSVSKGKPKTFRYQSASSSVVSYAKINGWGIEIRIDTFFKGDTYDREVEKGKSVG